MGSGRSRPAAPAAHHVDHAAIEALAERERRLAAREQDIRQREAELERWAEQHGAPSPSKDSLSGEDPPRQEAPAEAASKRVHRASIKPGHGVSQELFVHLAGKQPKTKERSPVPAAEAPNPNKQVPKEAMEARALRVFVCSSLQGSDGHALLTSEVYKRLCNDASRRGVSLTFVDVHDDLATAAQLHKDSFHFELHAIDLMLRELDECCLFVGILDDCYGAPLGEAMCDGLFQLGHTWIEDEGLDGCSVEEVLVRKALRSSKMAMGYSHFHLVRRTGGSRPGVEQRGSSDHTALAWKPPTDADRNRWRAQLLAGCGNRGLIGALEKLISQFAVSVSQDERSVASAVYAQVRQLLDTFFPLEGKALASNNEHSMLAWKPGCGHGWWAGTGHVREMQVSQAYQDFCLASRLTLCPALEHALTSYALDQHVDEEPLSARSHKGSTRQKQQSGKALAVLEDGSDGSAVSAYLAIWAHHMQQHHPNTLVVYHRFAACGDPPRAVEDELAVVMARFKARLHLLLPVPSRSEVRQAWPDFLAVAASHKPVLLILDGLERLPDMSGSLAQGAWSWLPAPAQMPRSCKVVLGVGNDAAVHAHHWRTNDMPPLNLIQQDTKFFYVYTSSPSVEEARAVYDMAIRRRLTAELEVEDDNLPSVQELTEDQQPVYQSLMHAANLVMRQTSALSVMLVGKILAANAQALMHAEGNQAHESVGSKIGLRRRGKLKLMGGASVSSPRAPGGPPSGLADVASLMVHALHHIEEELGSWLPVTECFSILIQELATAYMPLPETILVHVVETALASAGHNTRLTRLGTCAVLRCLRPYLWHYGGHVHAGHVLASAIAALKGAPVDKAPVYDPFASSPHPALVSWQTRESVSEQLWLLQSSNQDGSLSEVLTDMRFFLAAYHSEFWRDYTAAWKQLASVGQMKMQLAVNLRVGAQQYEHVLSTDGVRIDPSLPLHAHLRLVHALLLVRFLCQEASSPEDAIPAQQGAQLIRFVETSLLPMLSDKKSFGLAVSLHAAMVHHALLQAGDANEADTDAVIKDLAAALTEKPRGDASMTADSAFWREEAYVQGFRRDCLAAGHKLLATLEHRSSQLTSALASYEHHVVLVEAQSKACAGLELIVSESQWMVAKLKYEMAMYADALLEANNVLATVSKHLGPGDALLIEVSSMTTELHSKLHRKVVIQADKGGSDILEDMGSDDRQVDSDKEEAAERDLSLLPGMFNDFESFFWQHKWVPAYRVARRLVRWLDDHDTRDTGLFVDAGLKFSRVCLRLGELDEGIGCLRVMLRSLSNNGTAHTHVHVIEPSIELVCLLLDKGFYVEASELLDKVAASGIESRLDSKHPIICRMLYGQASLRCVRGAHDEALEKLRSAEAGQKVRLLVGDSVYMQLLDTRLKIVEVLHAKHDVKAAQDESQRLQHDLEKMFGDGSFEGAVLKYFTGCLLVEEADFKAADTTLREVSRTITKCAGKKWASGHSMVLLTDAKIAEIGQHQARYKDSDYMYQQTIDRLAKSQLDAEHSLVVAQIREGYSKLQLPLGRPAAAVQLLSSALDARRKVPGANRDALFSAYVLMALQEISLGQLSQARVSLDNLVTIQDSMQLTVLQSSHVKFVEAMLALEFKQDLKHAESCMLAALEARRQVLATDHPLLALGKLHLATILIEQHRLEETLYMARQVTSALSAIYGKGSAHLSSVNRLQARVFLEQGKYHEALIPIQDAFATDVGREYLSNMVSSNYKKHAVGKDDRRPAVLQDLELLAAIQYGLGNLSVAQKLLQEVRSVARDIYGDMEHPLIARSLVALAKIRQISGDYVEAHSMLSQGLDMQVGLLGSRHPDTILSQLELVELQHVIGDESGAMQSCTQLRATLMSAASPNHLQIVLVEAHMARLQFVMGQTLKPWAALTRSFIALDQAVVLVNAAAHANVDVKKNNAKDGAGRPVKAAAVEAGAHTSKTAADVQKELEQTSEAQSLSTKLQAAYTDSLTHLASVHIHEFNNHQAVLLLKIALEGYRKMGVLGKHGEAAVWTMQAHVALQRGRIVEAKALFQRAQREKHKMQNISSDQALDVISQRHPELLGDVEGLARMCILKGEYRQTKDLLQAALDLTNNKLAARNSRRSGTLLLLGRYMLDIGRYQEASKVLRAARGSLDGFSDRAPLAVQTTLAQAALDAEVGFATESAKLLEQVDDLGVLPAKHPDKAMLHWYLARVHMIQYQFAAARACLDAGLSQLNGSGMGAEAQRSQHRQHRLARACQHVAANHTNKPMIVKFLRTIVPLSWKLLDRQDQFQPLRMRFSLLHAQLLVQEGDLLEATAVLSKLQEGYTELNHEAAVTRSHPLIGCCHSALAQVAFAQGRFADAKQTFALAMEHKLNGGWLASHVSVAGDHHGIGLTALALANYDEAHHSMKVAKLTLLRSSEGASTVPVLGVDLALAQLALECGALRPDPRLAPSIVDELQKMDVLKRLWFMRVFLENDAVARDRLFLQVAAQCEVITFAAGDVVAQPDEEHPFMLILVNGSLDVLLSTPQESIGADGSDVQDQQGMLAGAERVAVLRAGDTFGERCVLLSSPFAVTLHARAGARPLDGVADAEDPRQQESHQQESTSHEDGVDVAYGEALLVPRQAFALLFEADSSAMQALAPLMARAWRGLDKSLVDSTTAVALKGSSARALEGADAPPDGHDIPQYDAETVLEGFRRVFGKMKRISAQEAQEEHSDMLLRVPSDPGLDYKEVDTGDSEDISDGAKERGRGSLQRVPSTASRALSKPAISRAMSQGAGANSCIPQKPSGAGSNEDKAVGLARADKGLHATWQGCRQLVERIKRLAPDPAAGGPAGSASAATHLLVQALVLVGQAALMQGAYARAYTLLDEAYQMSKVKPYGSCFFDYGTLVLLLARSLLAVGRAKPALHVLLKALSQIEAMRGSLHWQLVPVCMGLAQVQVDQGRASDAHMHAKRAASVAYEVYGPKHPRTADARSILAQVLLLQGKFQQSAEMLRNSIELKTRAGWLAQHPSMAEDRYALSECLAALGQYEEASEQLELATDMKLQYALAAPQRAAETLRATSMRAKLLLQQGLFEKAQDLARKILDDPIVRPRPPSPRVQSPDREQLDPRARPLSVEVPAEALETHSLRISAHLILTQVCRVRGEQEGAVVHARTAREMSQERYSSWHPTAIQAALEWARAHCAVRATLTAHLEAESAVMDADKMVRAAYGHPPALNSLSTAVQSDADLATPLHLQVNTAMAEVLCAKSLYPAAVENAKVATTGLQALLAPHSARDMPSDGARAPLWVLTQARLDEAKCLAEAGSYVQALQALCSFYVAVDEIWGAAPSAEECKASTGGDWPGSALHQADRAPSVPASVEESKNHRTPSVLNMAPNAAPAPPPLADLRLHRLGLALDNGFAWHDDSDETQPPAGDDLQPKAYRFSTLSALEKHLRALGDESGTQLGLEVFLAQQDEVLSEHQALGTLAPQAPGPLLAPSAPPALGRQISNQAPSAVPRTNSDTDALTSGAPALARHRSDMPVSTGSQPVSGVPAARLVAGQASAGMDAGGRSSAGVEGTPQMLVQQRRAGAFHLVRLVEVDALHLQARLLVCMCRWGRALDTIQQLTASLMALDLTSHAAVEDCRLLRAVCLSGLGLFQEAEADLRDIRDSMLHARITQSSSDSLAHAGRWQSDGTAAHHVGAGAEWRGHSDRDRFFHCVKVAGSIREVMQDFVTASSDYTESAQTWALANDFTSQHHHYVLQAAFNTTRARWLGGLLADESELEAALAKLTKCLTDQHPVVSAAQLDVAEALLSRNKLDEAETLLLQAKQALQQSCGRDHPTTARCSFRLAIIYHLRGPAGRRYNDVVPLFDKSFAIQLRTSGPRHVALFPIMAAYSQVCREGGAALLDQQVLLRRWALRILIDTHGPESELVDGFRDELIDCLRDSARIPEAKKELNDMLAAREESHGASHLILCDILQRLARLELLDGRDKVAATRRLLLERSNLVPRRHAQDEIPTGPPPALISPRLKGKQKTEEEDLEELSDTLKRQEHKYKMSLNKAAKLLERSLSIKQESRLNQDAHEVPGRMSRATSDSEAYGVNCCTDLEMLGQVHGALGDMKEAKRMLELAIETRQREIADARAAKAAVIPGHTRQERSAGQRVQEALLNKAESQRLLAALCAEAASTGTALRGEVLENSEHADSLYREALAVVSEELGLEHPRTLALKASVAALCRSHFYFESAQRLYEY